MEDLHKWLDKMYAGYDAYAVKMKVYSSEAEFAVMWFFIHINFKVWRWKYEQKFKT